MIALIGERNPAYRAHAGIEASLTIWQRDVDPTLTFRWFSTTEVTASGSASLLQGSTGVWCVPGSPYADTAGALAAIRYARETSRSFLGTCGGFQHALMEFYQNKIGGKAAHQEMEPDAPDPLISKLGCSLTETIALVRAAPGNEFSQLLGGEESAEGFNCNYGLAPEFESAFSGSSLEFVAHDALGQVRAFRLVTHPFFVGTLFQPERRALKGTIHPLVRAFLIHASRR